ncbi:protein kinase superfamily protein [Actinidia rufa]|uniref:Protein kinase superfamily protein n=1 Tax=Actinidia rufa TaxID=165716 RepID=A0A7J0DHX7_9ERIC|nr:protein kinase superfamily protein [Actinidia rufa]
MILRSKQVVGTVGCAAPEYVQTGRLTAKSDIWSYGVLSLVGLLIRPHLSDMKKFELILDPRLNGRYSLKSAQKLAAIANRCLVRHPRTCPKMSEVLEMVNRVVEATKIGSPEIPVKSSPGQGSGRNLGDYLKRRLVDPIIGENRWLTWRSWRPKLVRTN